MAVMNLASESPAGADRVHEKKGCRKKLNIVDKVNAQSMIVKRCLNDNPKFKKSTFAKNPGAYFTLKTSTNQRFVTYAVLGNS